MNRVIIIGNGFDLAHGMNTGYGHFMSSYWKSLAKQIPDSMFGTLDDGFTKFEKISGPETFYDACNLTSYGVAPGVKNDKGYCYQDYFGRGIIPNFCKGLAEVNSYSSLKKLVEEVNKQSDLQFKLSFSNDFFRHLSETVDLNLWLDIENEYHEELKKRAWGKHNSSTSVAILNKEFDQVKKRLADYLSSECKKEVSVNNDIATFFKSLFRLEDIALSQQDTFLDNLFSELSNLPGGMNPEEIEEEMRKHPEYSVMRTPQEAYREMIKDWIAKGLLNNELRPKRTLLLNFNYTDTAGKLYVNSDNENGYELIYIHGELKNPANPIIFGYGDEMDEDYQKIVNLNKNEFMKNLKPIRYHETNHHTNLLAFINSAPYQVFIMGHSCGNSDRTVLNTLFEHKNCLSIKTFFHQREDGTDDHLNTIQNISRHFKDAAKRDRIANKTLCNLHPQNKELVQEFS